MLPIKAAQTEDGLRVIIVSAIPEVKKLPTIIAADKARVRADQDPAVVRPATGRLTEIDKRPAIFQPLEDLINKLPVDPFLLAKKIAVKRLTVADKVPLEQLLTELAPGPGGIQLQEDLIPAL